MSMKHAKQTLASLLLGSALCASSMAQAADLNLVFLANEEDQEYDAALVFKNYVESRTGGDVNVNIFAGAQLCGSANECFEAMQAGIVDLYTATAGGVASIYPPIQGLDIPYAFPDDRAAMNMLTDPQFTGFLRDEILDATNGGIRLMSMTQTLALSTVSVRFERPAMPRACAFVRSSQKSSSSWFEKWAPPQRPCRGWKCIPACRQVS